jgi:hypothetical protein
MVDFANSPNVTNRNALIENAIAYRKHPRNVLNINGVVPSTPYCQKVPRNQEVSACLHWLDWTTNHSRCSQLNGLVNVQLDGADPGIFGSPALGVFPFGDCKRRFCCRCHSEANTAQSSILSFRPGARCEYLQLQVAASTVFVAGFA